MIEAPTYSLQPATPQIGLNLNRAENGALAIYKATCVDADAHRIFSALTVPEYLEAWISIPGAEPDSFTLAKEEENGYCLDVVSAGGAALSIAGTFVFCHLRKIRMFWRKTGNALCASSVVDFRVRGNFGSSIVELRHSALGSADEHAWYGALWRRSLERLAALLRSS
jgi:hypothetical protein